MDSMTTIMDRYMRLRTLYLSLLLLTTGQLAAAQDLFTVGNGASLSPNQMYLDTGNNPVAGGAFMGLVAADDIDGLSHNLTPGIGHNEFAVTFSIERADFQTGVLGPVPISADLPLENVETQERREQAAGDQFGSTEVFRLGTGVIPGAPSLGLNNNVLLINQSPWSTAWSGLRERGLSPPINETVCNFANPQPICSANVPTMFVEDANGASFGPVNGVYFTVTDPSPRPNLPPGNGATVYYDPSPSSVAGDEVVFATSSDLGLGDDEDIDALLVWDTNSNGVYEDSDQVIYSLATASPPAPPGATLYLRPFGGPTTVFAEASIFGLDVDAEIDALAAMPLDGIDIKKVLAGIAAPETADGDLNSDGDVNGLDVMPFIDVLLGGIYTAPADMNGDGAVDGLDVDPFVAAILGDGTAAVPEPSTLFLALVALAVVAGWRKWKRAA